MAYDPPLSGIEILDLSTGPMTEVAHLLADLGARVTAVRLAGVTADDTIGPHIDAVPIGTAITRAGIPTLDIETETPVGQRTWTQLLAGADILIENTRPGSSAEALLAIRQIRVQHPSLVILSISDFGRDSSYRSWQATTPVLHALTSELSRSGIPGRVPLLPPGQNLPYQVAAAQAALFVVSVYLDRLRCGTGDLIDFSVLEGAMQTLDPPFGTAGSASAGVPVSEQQRDWAAEQQRYPIIRCKDGHVRICLLAKRQWQGMFEWMGCPEEFADPRFNSLRERVASAELFSAIEKFCAEQTRAELELAGQRHRVPTAAVLTLAEALATEQVAARGFLRDTQLAPGLEAPVPVGIVEIDGHRASRAHDARRRPRLRDAATEHAPGDHGLPLEGLRVLDLGVIVVGSDTGRLLADLGADVVKIENSAFPDGLRFSLTRMTQTYAAGHRNKRSIGIDLRTDEGRALAHRLAEQSDVVLTNFKPGVAQALGMDHATLHTINPGIVVVDSSAYGPTGPWAARLGYGPLVRAKAGFTELWKYPADPDTFCDTVTVYPDHVAARIGALSAVALLLRRERSGTGGSASIAQSEVMLSHLAAEIAGEVLTTHGHTPTEPTAQDAPWGIFPANGDDAWVAVTVRDDADWAALCEVMGDTELRNDPDLQTRAGRDRHRCRIDEAVAGWTTRHTPTGAMGHLQAAGVPAGAVLHAVEVPEWDYYVERRDFREELHPRATVPFMVENVQIHSDRIADPPLGQAPLLGEQTREIASELLDLDDEQIDDLIGRGVLEVPAVEAHSGR
ncbi:CaiB/BaiF CoA-transferase family protein [[Mycobacterium] zoologicum]|uniref:CaiB/BaiF CoA-transferase family protein n=1 Tax=[Mycobacterium] zoologicum TaxID=2872311 RepID=UPI002CB24789|nr:CoA transferase [Mycolicibacter sp. MYC101]MEB3065498.1 CoA transferase [Mycolicibacter sp. MYC101]